MSTVPSYFGDFLGRIKLTDRQVDACKKGHRELRERLLSDEGLKSVVLETFLQGSYKRSTAVRPIDEDDKPDVDVVVVTILDRNKLSPREALERFRPFLDKYYSGKYEAQGRSWGIELAPVKLDLVPTAAPSEALRKLIKSLSVQTDEMIEDLDDWRLSEVWQPGKSGIGGVQRSAQERWRTEPLWIPDRDAGKWDRTHPLAQIEATHLKNAACNGHYVNVVRCLKWWRVAQRPEPKYPKSYPLEHMCWINCPDGVDSIAAGVVGGLEGIRDRYKHFARSRQTPVIPDHGVPEHNVLQRVSGNDFAAFHAHITEAVTLARQALDAEDLPESVRAWRKLFGDRFPAPPLGGGQGEGDSPRGSGGYTQRKDVSIIGGGRYACRT